MRALFLLPTMNCSPLQCVCAMPPYLEAIYELKPSQGLTWALCICLTTRRITETGKYSLYTCWLEYLEIKKPRSHATTNSTSAIYQVWESGASYFLSVSYISVHIIVYWQKHLTHICPIENTLSWEIVSAKIQEYNFY